MNAGARNTRVTSADGVELAVVEVGSRAQPTVLLVHGYPDTKEVWTDVADHLAAHFHVVAYDVRGAGQSDAPRRARAYDYDRLADDVLAVLDATAPDQAVHLVGHDWGSIQAWEFATSSRLDGRLASFTSIAGPSIDHVGHWLRHAPLRHRAGQFARSWYVGLFQVPLVAPLAWRTVIGRRWPVALGRLERIDTTAGHPAPTLARDGARGVKLYRRNMPRRLLRPRADAHARVPVQLIQATGDPFVSPHLFDDLERWVPQLRRRVIDSGHWLPRRRPELLAGWISEFARDVDRGQPLGRWHTDRRLALVTGAGSGIGRATALAFADVGMRVVAVDIDGGAADRTVELGRALGADIHAAAVDVTDAEAMEDLAKSVLAEHGVVDVLVNNAGIGIAGPFLATELGDWRRTLDVNLFGVIHGCRAFARQMIDRGEGGHIVNVASAAAFQPSKGLPAYSTSKAAVLMLSECLRADFAGYGIGVTAVCPGIVATNITRTTRFVGRDAETQAVARSETTRLYRRRAFPPEKVADAIVRAVRDNRAVVDVTPEAAFIHRVYRFAPGLLRRIARVEVLP
jgi:NAD(P)-dependent dehydrogenase (short-subunit alcohol dehydrogenase family)/pimeloyl-ACP methyl ester carboxylesterase